MSESKIKWTEVGAGQPVVLVHGFPLDGRVWDGVTKELASDFRVIVPDLPGFGASKVTGPVSFTMESLADTLHETLSTIGLTRYVLAGLSMGGYVALAYAKKYGAELAGLVLVDTRSDADTAEGKVGRDNMIDLVRKSGAVGVAGKMLPNMLAPLTFQSRPDVVERLKQIMESCPANAIEAACVAMRDRPDFTPVLATLKTPTLIVVGEHDAIISPTLARTMHDRLAPSLRSLAVVPDAGHMVPVEQPQAVALVILNWLKISVGVR